MEISTSSSNIEEFTCDGIIIGCYENLTGSCLNRLKDQIDNILQLGDFSGKKDQDIILYNVQGVTASRIIIVGLGKEENCNEEKVRLAASLGIRKLRKLGVKDIAIESLNSDPKSSAEGVILGNYKFNELMTLDKENEKLINSVTFCGDDIDNWSKGSIYAKSQNFARRLSELPANIATPTFFVDETIKLFDGIENVKINSYDENWAKSKNMGAFLSVAAGSDEPAKFLEIIYSGGNEGDQPLVFVGKGITFDTGGISIKGGAGMGDMRADCSGAAAVIGTLYGIAKLGLKLNVIGLAPLTENMPSGKATKPSDVIFASNGKSIEIDNTDAEGRLILSDALVYSETFNPHTIIDIATLTGAMMIALGDAFIGTFTRSDDLWDELENAGITSHQRFWRMPLDEIYRKKIKSTIADIKNVGGRAGGACSAAMFIGEFVENVRWAHLDIAGVMKGDGKGYYPKGMTGFPVRALIQLAENR